jgi:hypothetical protein
MEQCHLKKLAAATSKLALTFLAANMIGLFGARAEDPKAMFKEMSDYLASQNAIAFDYDANLDVVTGQGERLGPREFRLADPQPPEQAARNAHRRIC